MTAVAPKIRTIAARSVVELAAHPGTLYVAIVQSADGVRLAMAGVSRVELVHRLADYVRARRDHTLWPDDARYVRTLLVRGELEAAVEVYFGRVGERWDGEWLATTAITPTADAREDSDSDAGSLTRSG